MSTTGGRPHIVRPHIVVVGGGLAGLSAALDLADAGARVTLLERRRGLGGLTRSFRHDGREIDNGQHVFLRCCTEYQGFLQRIGSQDDVFLQERLDVAFLRPGAGRSPRSGRLHRNRLPAPLHLGLALARFPHLEWADRARIGLAALPLRRLNLDDPRLDRETFGAWLARHHQSPAAIEILWDPLTISTVNLPAAEASLAMGAKVFVTGLLRHAGAADIGWSRIPLGQLHGERAAAALDTAGVAVHVEAAVSAVTRSATGWTVHQRHGAIDADAVVVALPHTEVAAVLPAGAVAHQDRLGDLGTSAIVDVHVLYDRPVTSLAFAAGLGTPVQWVFDNTEASGAGPGRDATAPPQGPQCLAVSLSAADDLLGRRPDDIGREIVAELSRMFPAAGGARVLDTIVTKERHATFRAIPGTAALRPPAATAFAGLAVAGAWTATGWPATMEGAVRSGHAAARAVLAGTALAGTTPAGTTPAGTTPAGTGPDTVVSRARRARRSPPSPLGATTRGGRRGGSPAGHSGGSPRRRREEVA
jgi:squalene-associated FAD-dependent desaturase